MNKRSFYLLLSSVVSSSLGGCGEGEEDEEECPHVVVLSQSERAVSAASACQSIETLQSMIPYFGIRTGCAELCADPKMNSCLLPEAYMMAFRARNSIVDAGSRVCPDWEPTIVVTCQQEENRGKWTRKCPVAGRRPGGLLAVRRHERCEVADYLARTAHLEAASVFAFDNLAEDLANLGAPIALVEECALAARQERTHARVMGRLARARGARPPSVDVMVRGRMSLRELALENVVEGVVRESYGALQASFSERRAADPEVRAAMAAIAVDEAAHAWLAQQIAEWVEPLLSHAERAEVARAKARAIDALRDELEEEPALGLRNELGVPSRAQALRLFGALAQRVWQVAA